MYSLFQNYDQKEYGIVRLTEWKYMHDCLRRNLVAILEYYQNTSVSVASDHLLVQLLQSIAIPHSLSIERYYANIAPLALTLAFPFHLTSPISTGRPFNGVFYGKGNREVIIAVDEYFDPVIADKNWRALTPVKVLRHPFTDLRLNIPDGTVKSQEQGIVVITINIPMLAVQYRAFRREEMLRVESGVVDAERNIMQFVMMYPLSNLLMTHLDQALFNRFNHLFQDLPVHTGRSYHPFHLTDYSRRVTDIHKKLLGIMENSNYNFGATLAFIPGAVQNDMERAMLLPDIVPTRQVLWSLVLARLPALLFLISSAKYGAKMRNQMEVDQIVETFLRLKRQRVFESTLPGELYKETMQLIDSITTLSNNPKTE